MLGRGTAVPLSRAGRGSIASCGGEAVTRPGADVGLVRATALAALSYGQTRSTVTPFSIRWLTLQVVSFETLFVLYLYSNEIKVLLPTFPIDETVLFGALSMAVGGWIIARNGLYVSGLITVGAATLFVVYAIISCAWTPSKILAKPRLAYLVVFNMWCVIGAGLVIASSRMRTLRFLVLVLACGTFVAIMGMKIYITYGNFRTLDMWDELGFSRTYLNWGYTVADGAGVALVIALFSRLMSVKQIAAGCILLVCAAFLLVGGARGPLVGLGFAGLVALSVRPPRVGPGRFDISVAQLLGVVALALLASYVTWSLTTGEYSTTLGRFMKLADEAEGDKAVQGASRWEYWPAAIRFWLAAPLLGNGYASFSTLYHLGAEKPGAHPHNVILQIMAELGLVGLVLFGLFVWSALRHVTMSRLRQDPLFVAALIYLSTAVMNSMFAKELTGGRKLFAAVALLCVAPAAQIAGPLRRQVSSGLRARVMPTGREPAS